MVNTGLSSTGKCLRNLKLTVAYDGTAYHGFQRQTNALSIQQVLEERLAKIFGHPLQITGAGRTDAGVHAYGQVINFFTSGRIPVVRIPAAAGSVLPGDIAVQAATEVPLNFHARFDAKRKTYIYKIFLNKINDPFSRNYAWRITDQLDIAAMDEAARLVVGHHDFSAFRAAGGVGGSAERTIFQAGCRANNEQGEFYFSGSGFLYHMVRNMVGTLVDVGRGRISAREFAAILAGRDRSRAGITAPPHGLYLKEIIY